MAGIGFGKFPARQVLGRLIPATAEQPAGDGEATGGFTSVVKRVFGSEHAGAIKVKGHDDLLVYRARCCNPIRGEDIVGYVTRGKGVAVHAKNCPNVLNLMYDVDRRIAVEWAKAPKAAGKPTYPVKLTVYADDRAGILKQLTAIVSDDNTNIRNIEARTGDSYATVDIVIDIEDLKHLERIIVGLRKVPGIRDVQRVQKL
jgi:GTP pyrophosphokinase